MIKKADFQYILTIIVSLILTALPASGQSLLDVKKWEKVTTTHSGNLTQGNIQGLAYYNGKLVQFKDGTRKETTDGVTTSIPFGSNDSFDIATSTWTAGFTVDYQDGRYCHAGSASFGNKTWKKTDGYKYDCTQPFVFISGHYDPTGGNNKKEIVVCFDMENKQRVATLVFPNLNDDAIFCYDFENNKVWMIGYPTGTGKSPWIIREFSVPLSTIGKDWTEMKTIEMTEWVSQTQVGGPESDGIQKSLTCGTVQDCHYVNGKIYFDSSRGSLYNRTEFVKIHCFDTSKKQMEKDIVLPIRGEAQGFTYDSTNDVFYMSTTTPVSLYKTSKTINYDTTLNYEPATETSTDNYSISNASQLCWFLLQVYGGRTTINATLTQDIDLTGITLPTSNYVYMDPSRDGFDAHYAFRGEFNGDGHTIKNLSITSTPYYNNGLFPYCISANIHDLTVKGAITLTTCTNASGTSGQPVANVGLIGYMDGGTVSNVNAYINIDETVAGVSGTINKLVGGTGSTAPTTTNCSTEDPSQKTHAQNGGNHMYENGFCICTDAAKNNAGYYEAPVLLTSDRCTELGISTDYATNGYYEVKNAGNMFWISKNFSSIENNRKFVMTADIDMAGNDAAHQDWAGIATTYSNNNSTHFQGVFDGLGHKFTNYYMNVTSGNYKSMFGVVTKATIKNFSIAGSVDINNSGAQYGVVVGRFNEGPNTIEDIHSSVNITVTNGKTPSSVGGIIGQCSSGTNMTTVNRCRYSGTITGNSAFSGIGGIIGNTEGKLTMTNCLFDGHISSTSTATKTKDADGIRIGGLAGGQTGQSLTIQNCLVVGTIEVNSSSEAVGDDSHSGIVFGDNSSTGNLTITNTYYRTTGCTSGLKAIGLNNCSNKSTAAPTLIESQTWEEIKTSLNGSSNPANWGINSQDYPVPGEVDGNPKYTITFNTNGGSAIDPIKQEAGTEITAPEDPTKTGYKFAGWDKAIPTVMPEQDMTITAQWTVNQYTISFDMNGATSAQIEPITQDYGTTITKPTDPSKTDWIFAGWTPSIPSTMPAENITCQAQWSQDSYNNGFNTNSSCATEKKYEEPVLLTESRCTELGIATTYATNDYYEVKNAGNMFWIAQNISNVNNNRKYVMTTDIDMDGTNHKDWTGIGKFVNGNSDYNFKGIFDGLGHKFTNYYMKVTGSDSWKGMFCVPNGATIKNFSISGIIEITSTGTQFGAIGGRITGTTTIEDIHSAVNITVEAGKTPASIGGLIGQCSAQTSFNRCRYSGTITGNSAYKNLGGIFGNAEGIITVNNCLFDGTITSTSTQPKSEKTVDDAIQIGGVGGRNNNKTTITNCLMNGTITVDANSEAVDAEKTHSGIIFGYQHTTADLTITNTYYSTSKCTSGIRAVGLNEATTSSKANPTLLNNESATTLRVALGTENWKMVDGITTYPVPGTGGPAIQTITITFDTNGGSAITPISGTEGEAITAPAAPTKVGHTFAGWVDKDGNATTVPTVMPSANLTIYASWTVNQYTITLYETEGGKVLGTITQNYGTAITKPTDPEREDYEFNGWSPAIPSTMPGENMTCVAQWVQETYNNGFNTDAQCAAAVKYQRPKGAGTAEDPYLIDNGGKLWWFATQVKGGQQALCARLTDNINTECNTRVTNNGTNMPQMGGEITTPYTGTFDGNGYTISNWKQIWSGYRAGMFGYTTNATIMNFTLEGEMTVSGSAQQMAPVVGNAGAGTTIEDIWSKVDIAANGTVFIVGGVAGRQAGTLNRCRYSGKITCADGVFNGIGGIVGETYAGTTNNCLFDGTIIAPSSNATLRVGGIVGTQSEAAASTIKNCFANGTITLANYSTETSGIVMGGNTNQQYVYNMYYTRTNVSASLKRAAGISTKSAMGHCENVTSKDCLTDGTLVNMLGNGNWKQDETLHYPVPFKGTATEGFDANGFSYSKDGTHDAVTLNGEWYEIANGGQLLDFAQKVNAGTIALTSKARLTADVDLEWCDFPGIGDYSSSKKFQGTFDGQEHTIRGMYRNVVGAVQRKGMFNWVENATIKDFTVEGEIQVHEGGNSTYFIGGVVGIGDTAGTLEDVTSSVDINVIKCGETTRIIGGVAGRFKGTMNRCRYNGTIDLGTNTAQQVGGVLASAEVTTMSNCLFDGTIVAATSNAAADKVVIGGLLGIDNNAVTMKNCLSNGTITLSNASAVTTNVGAVWGQITKTTSSSTVAYYTTSGITKAGAALDQVGGANASSNMVTTAKGETSWGDVNSALNNNTTATGNWQILAGQEYPIPSYFSHEHEYDTYGFCSIDGCGQPEPITKDAEDDYYLIDHFADLGQFAHMVNNSPNGTEINAKVTKDIDLTNHEKITTEIGDKDHHYCGTFDGQGHTMKGVRVESDLRYVGLFACVGIKDNDASKVKHGIVKNFSVSGTVTASYFSKWNTNTPLVMGVIGEIYSGTVENVHSSVNFECTSGTRSHIGGVVGGSLHMASDAGEIVIKNCTYEGTMTLNACDAIGGIVGYAQHKTKISNTMYSGSITQNYTRPVGEEDKTDDPACTYIGGVLGYCNSESDGVKNSIIVGDMESNLKDFLTDAMSAKKNNMNICVGFDGSIDKSYANYYGNYITPKMTEKYHQLPSNKFSGTAKIRTDAEFATGWVCAELNADATATDNPWGQILGYQVGNNKDPNSPAQRYPYPGYTDPEQTSYKVVRTQNAKDDTKYDYTADYYFFDDFGDATPYPSDAASMKVKKIRYTRKAEYLEGYISMCLPWAFTIDMKPENTTCYQYASVSGNTVNFNEVTVDKENPIVAGTPFIMQYTSNEDWKPFGEINVVNETADAELTPVALAANNPSETGIYGTFDTKTIGANYYKLNSTGTMLGKTTDKGKCYPFRVYLKLDASSSNAKSYVPCWNDFEDIPTNVVLKDAYDMLPDDAQRYNALGQKVSKNTKGIVIVNGKKYNVK